MVINKLDNIEESETVVMFITYILGVIFIMLLIVDIFVKTFTSKGKKMELNDKAHYALLNMLTQHRVNLNKEEVNIIESKRHLFNPLQNVIGIRNFEMKTAFDHVASLHEGGHYLSITQNEQRRKLLVASTIIIAINRLLTIPLFMITIFIYGLGESELLIHSNVLTLALIFFIIASLLRISVGMFEEYRASKIAYEHIQEHYGEKVVQYAKSLLIWSFLNHLLLMSLIIVAIPLVYTMILYPA